MNRAFKAAVAALMLAVSFAGSVAAGPFEDATVAYRKGDYATALRLYGWLAEQGDASAQNVLGRMYDHGRGVPQDYAAALRWYRKAAEQGYARAQVNLGVVYFEGHGVPQDYAATVKWFRLAAEQGDAQAQNTLGVMYVKGLGVPQDYVQAHMWLNLAAAQGYEDAATSRHYAATFMTPAQMAEAQKLAREWRPKTTNAGPTQASQGGVPPRQASQRGVPSKQASQRGVPTQATQRGVPLKRDGGTLVVPVQINGTLTLDFVIDSGAADVSVPADVVSTLMRTGSIKETDFIGKQA